MVSEPVAVQRRTATGSTYLKERLNGEACASPATGGKARVFNFACGPAMEVQRFLADLHFSEQGRIDAGRFQQETLEHITRGHRQDQRTASPLRTPSSFKERASIKYSRKIRASRRAKGREYDFIYCAGLFDYLPDPTCRQLMNVFYDWLAPGGLLVVTNVVDDQPFRHMLEFVLDWHLIYRNANKAPALVPEPSSRRGATHYEWTPRE